MNEEVIPTSYHQWRHCIEVRCKIALTPDFVQRRLTELQDDQHATTKHFAKLYGVDHLKRTISWFHRASDEMASQPGERSHA